MTAPLVSIVTPAYNCVDIVRETVESVQTQTFADWELLVIDDASTDGTGHLLSSLAAQDTRIRVLRHESNLGPAVARNRGIELARGRLIAFLDSDDLWYPDKLQLQTDFMRSSGVALSYTNYDKVRERSVLPAGFVECPAQVGERELLRSNPIACSTAMYDVAQTGRVYMPLIRKRQDWGLWLRIARRGFVGHNVGKTLATYRVRSGSLSSNKLAIMAHNWRFFRDEAKIPFVPRLYRIASYAVLSVMKYRRARRADRREK
jgi:glycosyltransferase involved in cell wall biosynthesis